MALAADWLADFKKFWAGSFDQLDGLLQDLKQQDAEEDLDE